MAEALAALTIAPIEGTIGARVAIERGAWSDPAVVSACLDALEQRGALVFPRLALTPAEQLEFTEALGTRGAASRKFPGGAAIEGDMFEIGFDASDAVRSDYVKVSFFWHIDGLVADVPIPRAGVLSARRVAGRGGETEFADCYAAYQALPEADKVEIAGLRAVHTPAAGFRPIVDEHSAQLSERLASHTLERTHPLVWTHDSGRKSLMLGITADRIEGMPVAAGRALLARLTEWTAQPRFVYRHTWQEGDLVIWNNHGTMHRVIPYDEESGRSMHRTSID